MNDQSKTISEAILSLNSIYQQHGNLSIVVCVDGKNEFQLKLTVTQEKDAWGTMTKRLKICSGG